MVEKSLARRFRERYWTSTFRRRFVPRDSRVATFYVVTGIVTAPIWLGMLMTALFVAWWVAAIMFMILVAPFDSWHREHHAVPFSPGRWESHGGQFYVVLGEEGEPSSFRLPFDPARGCSSDAEPLEAAVTYEISGYNREPGATVARTELVELEDDRTQGGPTLYAGGLFSDGYDWSELHYSECDPDLTDVTLRRVEPDQ